MRDVSVGRLSNRLERATDKDRRIRTEDKLWYKCDPNKNTGCKKTGCKHNPDSVYPVCQFTSNRDYSIDGKPLTRSEIIAMSKEQDYEIM